jgi:hypothetical protein
VPAQRGDHGHRHRVDRGQRGLERPGEHVGEPLRREVADVVPRRERLARTGQHHAAGVQGGQGRHQRFEDLAVERVALGGVVDRDANDAAGRFVNADRAHVSGRTI